MKGGDSLPVRMRWIYYQILKNLLCNFVLKSTFSKYTEETKAKDTHNERLIFVEYSVRSKNNLSPSACRHFIKVIDECEVNEIETDKSAAFLTWIN